jgi:hypothetical protein
MDRMVWGTSVNMNTNIGPSHAYDNPVVGR